MELIAKGKQGEYFVMRHCKTRWKVFAKTKKGGVILTTCSSKKRAMRVCKEWAEADT